MKKILLLGAAWLCTAALAAPGWADNASPAAGQDTAAPAQQAQTFSDTTIGGFLDFYWENNFNKPPQGIVSNNPRVENTYRNFDFRNDSPTLSLMEATIVQNAHPFGVTINLGFGPATTWINASDPMQDDFWQHMKQLYATYNLDPKGTNVVDFGKFVTNAGAEVIESQSNWNYTRGLLFSWAIPYYHFGARFTHHFTDSRYVMLSLINGWNDVKDNNSAKSYGVTYNTPLGATSVLTLNYYGGKEPNVINNAAQRNLVDAVWTLSPTNSKWSYILNGDWANQKDGTADGSTATWYGLAGYAKYITGPTTNLALRGEVFRDKDGFATGTAQTLKEVTLTYDYHPGHHWIHRIEWRTDFSNQDVFYHSGDAAGSPSRKTQSTITIGSVYTF